MIAVIYVHGTGVRKREYEETLKLLEKNFCSFKNVKVESCLWGESFGVRLNANGMSIPTYDSTRAIEQYDEDEESVALWELLYVDPLYEIRALGICKKKDTFFHPGKITPDEELMHQLRIFKYSSSFETKLHAAGLDEVFADAFKSVIDSRPLKTAINYNPDIFNENRGIIARAIIAAALKICNDKEKQLQVLFDDVLRDDLVKTLTSEIGDTYRSAFSHIGKFFFSLAATPFVNHIKRRRGALTDRYVNIPGDILLYQARGHNIRNFIKKSMERTDLPVVLLAHSLGGAACMELLVQESLPRVKLLVTMGSQAPFLYEIDALHCLSYGTPLPNHFPNWLNIYNLRDFLSYVGAGVFPGKVTDVRITNRQPFPQSHHVMAYLSNKDTWDNILKKMKSINDR